MMCGIVGFWNTDNSNVNEKIIYNMMDEIKHRGPDDSCAFINGPLGMGFLRLSIVDVSINGRQPMITSDGKGVLIYNGELYNTDYLRNILKNEGIVFRSYTDTEVILYALHNWGPEVAVRKFRGMFALAYFDYRDNTLWLSRDRMGIKPLYIAKNNNEIVFSSEIKAILRHPSIIIKPDLHTLSIHMTHEYMEEPFTAFEGIESILPGSIYKIRNNFITKSIYFDVVRDLDVDRLISAYKYRPGDYINELSSKIDESVSSHMVSDVPIATFCSGGVDSSLITAIAKEKNANIIAYVASVEDAIPEYQKALLVGNHINVEIRQVNYSLNDYLRDWPISVWHNDQPPCYRSDQAFMAVAKACKNDGIKVVLTGEGADELFGGYEWHRDAYNMWRIWKISKNSDMSIGKIRNFFTTFLELSYSVKMSRTFSRFPTPEPNNYYNSLRRLCCESQINYRYMELFKKLERIKPIEERALLAVCYNDMYGHITNLLQRNDKMGMAASIESRVPFLDNNLIDYAMYLPARCKYNKKINKWILKEVAKTKLPLEIVYANKVGFSTSTKPYKYVIPLIRNGMVSEMFKWSSKYTETLLSELEINPYVLYTVAGIELWARIFINGESPEKLSDCLLENAYGECK